MAQVDFTNCHIKGCRRRGKARVKVREYLQKHYNFELHVWLCKPHAKLLCPLVSPVRAKNGFIITKVFNNLDIEV